MLQKCPCSAGMVGVKESQRARSSAGVNWYSQWNYVDLCIIEVFIWRALRIRSKVSLKEHGCLLLLNYTGDIETDR